jgi:anaerobic selenocysteine-containing dehydrogenase
MNATDAAARGIKDNDYCFVHNDVGGFKVHVKVSPQAAPGQVICYHAWEPIQFEDWMGSQTVVASPWKPLHLVGDPNYLQFSYRPILGQPSHIMRGTMIEVEKV